MMKILIALISGTLFGVGLTVSGMINPAKVIGFLDVAGDWDPTLALVMGGALLVAGPIMPLILRQPRPVLATEFHMPTKTTLDAPLLGGAALFGVGWGLSGFCPGPAVAALVPALLGGLPAVFVFTGSMVAGMFLHGWLTRRPAHNNTPQQTSAAPPASSEVRT